MNINHNFETDNNHHVDLSFLESASDAMEFAMDGIWDLFVEPIGEKNLSDEQKMGLFVIGGILKEIGKKAEQFEQSESLEISKN